MSVPPAACRCVGAVISNAPISQGLIRLDLEVSLGEGFLPGQFAMLNLQGPEAWVFGRPLSILSWRDHVVSFLYRVVGRGTSALAACAPGTLLSFLGPLGKPFPTDLAGQKAVLIAGGVGLPPIFAWWERFAGQGDLAFFGARNGADVPWTLVAEPWQVSLEDDSGFSGRGARPGLVTDLVSEDIAAGGTADVCTVLACGPWPLLKAVHKLASARRWPCWLSLEEHMGCGYGACKGCVVPVRRLPGSDEQGWRHATCCQEGPVFFADNLAWPELV